MRREYTRDANDDTGAKESLGKNVNGKRQGRIYIRVCTSIGLIDVNVLRRR